MTTPVRSVPQMWGPQYRVTWLGGHRKTAHRVPHYQYGEMQYVKRGREEARSGFGIFFKPVPLSQSPHSSCEEMSHPDIGSERASARSVYRGPSKRIKVPLILRLVALPSPLPPFLPSAEIVLRCYFCSSVFSAIQPIPPTLSRVLRSRHDLHRAGRLHLLSCVGAVQVIYFFLAITNIISSLNLVERKEKRDG